MRTILVRRVFAVARPMVVRHDVAQRNAVAQHDDGGEFDEQILADLISQGLSGKELLSKFKEMRRQIHPAVEALIDDAAAAANGKGDFSTYDDIFGAEGK